MWSIAKFFFKLEFTGAAERENVMHTNSAKQIFYPRLRFANSDNTYQEAAPMTTARQERRKQSYTGCSINMNIIFQTQYTKIS